MTDTLSISSSPVQGDENATVFHLEGRLDATGEDALCEKARRAFEGGSKTLLLDLHNLEYISSAGLRALHNIFQMCTPKEEIIQARENNEPYKTPYFKLAGAPPEVYSVLNLAGFLHNIPVYPTLDDALRA